MIIRAIDLGKRFGRLWALTSISFDVNGSIVAVLGPNGSGKTTLLTILAGLRYPTRGRAFINGIEPYVERERAVKMISFMFEKPRFNLGIKVKDIVEIVSDERGCHDEARDLAYRLGLNDFYETKLPDLSSGQAQLVGLWTSFACWSGAVILDEPFAHLDLQRVKVLVDIIRGRTDIIFTTHTSEEAEALADYIIILDRGRVVWAGTKDELFSSNTFEVYPIEDKEKLMGLLRQEGCDKVIDMGLTIIVKGCDEDSLVKLLKRGIISGFKKAGVRGIYAQQ